MVTVASCAGDGQALKGYSISFDLETLGSMGGGRSAPGAPQSARIEIRVVTDPVTGLITRLHSRAKPSTGAAGTPAGGLEIFWAAPARERTEFHESACELKKGRVPANPTFDDVLLDSVGPLHPDRHDRGFTRQGDGLFVREKDGFRYELKLSGAGRTYTHFYIGVGAGRARRAAAGVPRP
ncbi:hypothetical protein ACBJ59_35995 [Nonomuraea sp. MTCD27]|uniref:hypothetical protein n=1 Tax=Nonomuraea sp. MTCD27 TaxID=1676747 RepID=UPI0035C239AE